MGWRQQRCAAPADTGGGGVCHSQGVSVLHGQFPDVWRHELSMGTKPVCSESGPFKGAFSKSAFGRICGLQTISNPKGAQAPLLSFFRDQTYALARDGHSTGWTSTSTILRFSRCHRRLGRQRGFASLACCSTSRNKGTLRPPKTCLLKMLGCVSLVSLYHHINISHPTRA